MTEDNWTDELAEHLPADMIDPERHRQQARRTQGDPRPTGKRRNHPARAEQFIVTADMPLIKKYQTIAGKYSQLSANAESATNDDVIMNGSSRQEPLPSETHYRLQCDMARMVVRDSKERDGELVRLIRKALGTPAATILRKLLQTV
jgi:hypothetical protein